MLIQRGRSITNGTPPLAGLTNGPRAAVTGEYDDSIAQSIEQMRYGSAKRGCAAAWKVGSSNVLEKQCVAREDKPVEDNADTAGCMPGRVNDMENRISNCVAFPERKQGSRSFNFFPGEPECPQRGLPGESKVSVVHMTREIERPTNGAHRTNVIVVSMRQRDLPYRYSFG
jgi:hypothetical protein